MPRQMGYNSHRTSQALANASNNKYTSLRVQITLDRVTTIRLPREQRIEVASQAYRGIRRRQRIGFASAIETFTEITEPEVEEGRQRIGFASAIETWSIIQKYGMPAASPEDWLRVCD